MEIKKIYDKAMTVLVCLMFMGLTSMFSYQAILGHGTVEQQIDTETAKILCDNECSILYSHGTIPPNTTIEAKRQVLECLYDSMPEGMLAQYYWIGPWTDIEGKPLSEDLATRFPEDYNGDVLFEAKQFKDGKPVCPDIFSLRYGQRGLHL